MKKNKSEKPHQIAVRLFECQIKMVDKIAERFHQSRNDVISEAVSIHINRFVMATKGERK